MEWVKAFGKHAMERALDDEVLRVGGRSHDGGPLSGQGLEVGEVRHVPEGPVLGEQLKHNVLEIDAGHAKQHKTTMEVESGKL